MNKFVKLFFGVFGAFGVSWLGFVAYPYLTFAGLQPNKDPNTKRSRLRQNQALPSKGTTYMHPMGASIATANSSVTKTKEAISIVDGANAVQ